MGGPLGWSGARASPSASPSGSIIGDARCEALGFFGRFLSSAAARARAFGRTSPLNAHRFFCGGGLRLGFGRCRTRSIPRVSVTRPALSLRAERITLALGSRALTGLGRDRPFPKPSRALAPLSLRLGAALLRRVAPSGRLRGNIGVRFSPRPTAYADRAVSLSAGYAGSNSQAHKVHHYPQPPPLTAPYCRFLRYSR